MRNCVIRSQHIHNNLMESIDAVMHELQMRRFVFTHGLLDRTRGKLE